MQQSFLSVIPANMRQVLVIFALFFLRDAVTYDPWDDYYDEVEHFTHVPLVMSNATALEATAGESVTFHCDVDDLGDYIILWKHGKHRILFASDFRITRDDRIRINGTSLHITSVQPQDSGQYTCQISTTPPTELSHTLDVLCIPQVPLFTSKPHSSQETIYTISWKVNSSTPVDEYFLRYRKKADEDDWEIKSIAATHVNEEKMHTQMLQLDELQPATEYEAVVKAKNKCGWSEQSEALVFTTKSKDPLDYDYDDTELSTQMPRIISSATALEATTGESVTFHCDVADLGYYIQLWKHEKNIMLFVGGLRIIRDDRFQIDQIDGTSLHITSVQPQDSGRYTCQVSTYPATELSHTLDVLYPPSVSARPKEAFIAAKEGVDVTLTCDATGSPVPTITWKHAGRHYGGLKENRYVINDAQKNDSGQYECTADNAIGEPATAVITVEIVSAPKIYPDPRNGLVVVKEGEPVSIGCEATGDPAPVITWKKSGGGRLMKINDDENKIMISAASQNDAGNYECIANNSLGISASAVIRVQVFCTPEIPLFTSKPHSSQGTKYTISWKVNSDTPVYEYSLKYRKKADNDDWETRSVPASHVNEKNTHTQMFQLVELQLATEYEAVVQASNKCGWSQQSEVHVFTTKNEEKHSENSSSSGGLSFSLISLLIFVILQ